MINLQDSPLINTISSSLMTFLNIVTCFRPCNWITTASYHNVAKGDEIILAHIYNLSFIALYGPALSTAVLFMTYKSIAHLGS